MSELSNEERLQLRIRELENELKTAKSVLLHTSAQLIEERCNHAKTREYANTHQQENALLKERIEQLKNEATGTKERETMYYYSDNSNRERSTSPLSVSVSVSPRLHPQPQPQPQPQLHKTQYQCSPAMATCDGLYFSPSSSLRLLPDGSSVYEM
jgi:sugar-specific transcriptional regulator TrmB